MDHLGTRLKNNCVNQENSGTCIGRAQTRICRRARPLPGGKRMPTHRVRSTSRVLLLVKYVLNEPVVTQGKHIAGSDNKKLMELAVRTNEQIKSRKRTNWSTQKTAIKLIKRSQSIEDTYKYVRTNYLNTSKRIRKWTKSVFTRELTEHCLGISR